jgi:hypothetical protein
MRTIKSSKETTMRVKVTHSIGSGKIMAIKACRFLMNYGLKEAKDFIEGIAEFGENGALEEYSYETEVYSSRSKKEIIEFADDEVIRIDVINEEHAIESNGSQLFNVPNTQEGRVFINNLRHFVNNGQRFRCRGRGSRKEHGDANYVPLDHSEWIAVYPEVSDKQRDAEHAKKEEERQHWMKEGYNAANNAAKALGTAKPTSVLTQEAIEQIKAEGIEEGKRQARAEFASDFTVARNKIIASLNEVTTG